jgi:tetratricopeptide (TPR) repeat protein
MANRFFKQSDFDTNFENEITSAINVYLNRQKSGMMDNSFTQYDFTFISDSRDKLESLGKFLSGNYGYRISSVENKRDEYELIGYSVEFPVDRDNLIYWALDLYCKGYEFDCKLCGYGSMDDVENQRFPDMSKAGYDKCFELAMVAYNKRNLGISFCYFSTAIKIDNNDPNAWYSRAIIKDDLHTWKSARMDYDKAIQLAPDFSEAIINRAANKDEAGEYVDAIKDYTKAIELDPQNEMAYSKFNIKDIKGACEDWYAAKGLGSEYAKERIDKNCNKR